MTRIRTPAVRVQDGSTGASAWHGGCIRACVARHIAARTNQPNSTMSLLTKLSALLIAGASLLHAQVPVVARGQVTDGSAAGCYYCPGFSHVIKFVGTQLASPTINLALYHNQMVEMVGTWNGTVLEVASIQVVPDSFSIGGNTSLGHAMRPTAIEAPGTLALNLAALGTTFLVPFAELAVMMNPASTVILGAGVTNGNGEFKSDIDIPNDPSLVGLRVFGQALLFVNGGMRMSNVDAKEVSP